MGRLYNLNTTYLGDQHASDCAIHNGPALPVGECDCGIAAEDEIQEN